MPVVDITYLPLGAGGATGATGVADFTGAADFLRLLKYCGFSGFGV